MRFVVTLALIIVGVLVVGTALVALGVLLGLNVVVPGPPRHDPMPQGPDLPVDPGGGAPPTSP